MVVDIKTRCSEPAKVKISSASVTKCTRLNSGEAGDAMRYIYAFVETGVKLWQRSNPGDKNSQREHRCG